MSWYPHMDYVMKINKQYFHVFWTAKFEEQWSGCTDNTVSALHYWTNEIYLSIIYETYQIGTINWIKPGFGKTDNIEILIKKRGIVHGYGFVLFCFVCLFFFCLFVCLFLFLFLLLLLLLEFFFLFLFFSFLWIVVKDRKITLVKGAFIDDCISIIIFTITAKMLINLTKNAISPTDYMLCSYVSSILIT